MTAKFGYEKKRVVFAQKVEKHEYEPLIEQMRDPLSDDEAPLDEMQEAVRRQDEYETYIKVSLSTKLAISGRSNKRDNY
jgi:hypothetical protein